MDDKTVEEQFEEMATPPSVEEVLGVDDMLAIEELKQAIINDWHPMLSSFEKIVAQRRSIDGESGLDFVVDIENEIFTERLTAKYTLRLTVGENDG